MYNVALMLQHRIHEHFTIGRDFSPLLIVAAYWKHSAWHAKKGKLRNSTFKKLIIFTIQVQISTLLPPSTVDKTNGHTWHSANLELGSSSKIYHTHKAITRLSYFSCTSSDFQSVLYSLIWLLSSNIHFHCLFSVCTKPNGKWFLYNWFYIVVWYIYIEAQLSY